MDIEKEQLRKEKKSIWGKTFNKNKLKKPDKVAVLYLRKNNSAQGLEVDTKKGFFTVDGTTYHIQRDCQYRIGKEGIPLLVLEEECLVPRGNSNFYQHLKDLKSFEKKAAEYEDLVLKAIRHAELVRAEEKGGMKMNPKVAIGLIIAAVIGWALFKGFG